MRVRARYRRYAMTADSALPEEALRGLVGPDCAYHLYGKARRGKEECPPPDTPETGDE